MHNQKSNSAMSVMPFVEDIFVKKNSYLVAQSAQDIFSTSYFCIGIVLTKLV